MSGEVLHRGERQDVLVPDISAGDVRQIGSSVEPY